MATKPLTSPYSLKDSTFSVAADDYTAAIGSVEFVPSASPAAWTGIGGNTVQDVPRATWLCRVGLAQDLSPDGFLRYLLDHEGEKVACSFVPKAGGPTIAATVTITPAGIGGAAGTAPVVTSTVDLPVDGTPEFTDPTP